MSATAALRGLSRRALLRAARDVTVPAAGRSALVIAPHPDDETLGCGATMLAKVAAGTRVTVVVATDGRHSHRSAAIPPERLAARRHAEMTEAATRLGLVEEVRWLGIEDGTVAAHEDDLVAALVRLVAELRPDELYATCAEEPHPDHAAVGRAARRVAAATGTRLLEYPVWLWHGWPASRGDRAGSLAEAGRRVVRRRAAVVATGPHLAAKLHALDAHDTQLRRPAEVPVGEEWAVLPEPILAAAAGPWELFFPTSGGGR
ncbi:PIG-L deacetylase family protein [Nocardioides sp.]|uniref:PIG-L deacetylase family protein n=1 Tax=Nocardioides sp. TaxID=35761 RepID=UPI0039E33597